MTQWMEENIWTKCKQWHDEDGWNQNLSQGLNIVVSV